MRGYKLDRLAINSTTAVVGKAGFTLASAATAVVEFMAKWSNLYPHTVMNFTRLIFLFHEPGAIARGSRQREG